MKRFRPTAVALVGVILGLSMQATGALAGIAQSGGRTTCTYSPDDNTMSVVIDNPEGLPIADAVVRRDGETLEVRDNASVDPHRVQCEGGRPTVHNADSIRVSFASKAPFFALDLRGGYLEPGATDETDGSPEIEVRLGVARTSIAEILLPGSDDDVSLGALAPDGGAGVNFDASRSEDAEVVIPSGDVPIIHAGGGNDTVSPSGGPGFAGPIRSFVGIDGGSGRDRLTGSKRFDYLEGGRGRDRIDAGSGRDIIDARDPEIDIVDCGPGRDAVIAKHREQFRGCERVERPEPDFF